jgi:hypothetical protein
VGLILKPHHSTVAAPRRLGMPGENWSLERDGESIGLIERRATGVLLALSGGNWRSEVVQYGLYWGLAVIPVGAQNIAGAYRSRTLLAAGRVSLLPGNSYRLKPPICRDAWRLIDEMGEPLAEVCVTPADSLVGKHLRIDLTHRSDREAQRLLVVMIACVVIASHLEMPVPAIGL